MAAAALALLLLCARPPAAAQEATPAPVAPDLSTLSTTLVGLLPGVTLPANADIVVVRTEFAPGVVSTFAPGPDAADTLLIVENGELSVTVGNQPWSVSRAAVLNQALATPTADGDLFQLSSQIAAGEVGTLQAGDMTLIPATADGEMRNATMEPATALLIVMGPASP
ncbi:MAG: hypothetical protein KC442_15565 [Thermomicrobiales bacterium]|nr:hypothetical protein [Thermomicrobiales bacterium]